jgi:hypothetical protein
MQQGVWHKLSGTLDWMPMYLRTLDCGCMVDDLADGMMWKPCMAHEGDGHLCVISEQDGMWVVRCLVLVCRFSQTRAYEADAVGAAQGHWQETAGQH